MDIDALIASVYKRRPIWDKRDKLYANRTVTSKQWQEIALEVKFGEDALRKKWKYLRDNFSVEYSKQSVSRYGGGADNCHQSKWAYYQQLRFLRDIVTPRTPGSIKPSGTLATPQADVYIDNASRCSHESFLVESSGTHESNEPKRVKEDFEDGRQVDFTSGADLFPQTLSISASPQTPLVSRGVKRKQKQDDFDKRMCDIEEKTMQYMCNKEAWKRDVEDTDTDLMFLKSLLPHIRKIPQHMKLRFQSKVQSVVDEFAYNNNNNNNNENFDQGQTDTSAYKSYAT